MRSLVQAAVEEHGRDAGTPGAVLQETLRTMGPDTSEEVLWSPCIGP